MIHHYIIINDFIIMIKIEINKYYSNAYYYKGITFNYLKKI